MAATDPSRRGRGSRRKGKVGEREVAELLRAAGFGDAKRGQQRSGLDQADVVGGPPGWRLEVKRQEAVQLWAAWAQATADAERQGERPILALRRNQSPWLAVVRLDELLALLRESWLRSQGL